MGVSENRGPLYNTLNSRILILGTPKKGTPNFWKLPPRNVKYHISHEKRFFIDSDGGVPTTFGRGVGLGVFGFFGFRVFRVLGFRGSGVWGSGAYGLGVCEPGASGVKGLRVLGLPVTGKRAGPGWLLECVKSLSYG